MSINKKVLRLDKPARPANRLKLKAGSSANITQPNRENSDKGIGAGVGFLKTHLFGGGGGAGTPSPAPKKQHQPYSDYSDDQYQDPTPPRRVRAPSSAPQIDPSEINPSNGGRRVRAPSSAPQVEPPKSGEEPSLTVGDVVMVDGLKARPDINGCKGRISSYDSNSGRWVNGEFFFLFFSFFVHRINI
jgi:hypothetical protein